MMDDKEFWESYQNHTIKVGVNASFTLEQLYQMIVARLRRENYVGGELNMELLGMQELSIIEYAGLEDG